ncbi:uncharacterized protein BJ212DRAFT_1298684 [Suillus subaureus]|uniref:Uncharacterized protein n=1 Tax=Suillus subaureus TaxID=48587 RepID=A0A9P7JF51_9AGAM|nr:uncharacterized protein BJ212DRAFT_1298684 [Suillus subaureus]KAG1818614.1 hypothetical protein BJ212DRAFT_1298684 [Suillus subaureus]
MCGLDSYPGIDHRKGSLDMIERFIKDREAAWTSKKEASPPKMKKSQECAGKTKAPAQRTSSRAKQRATVNPVRTLDEGLLKDSQWEITEVPAVTHVDAGKSPIRHGDHTNTLMNRAFIEGNRVLVSRNLVSWMIEQYCILVGIPLNEPLHGQLIPQSPDEYHNLTEHDYLEALGIECLYAPLVNAEESPDHLIHLTHALGRAIKETHALSYSKPSTQYLDPLPPMFLPIPMIPCRNSSIDSTDTGDHDGSVSNNACTANAHSALPGSETQEDLIVINSNLISNACSRHITHVDDNCVHINVNDGHPDVMDTEAVRGGHGDDNNNDSKDGMDGEGKRKRVDSLAPSPSVVLLFLDKGYGPCLITSYLQDLLQLKWLRKAHWPQIWARNQLLGNALRKPIPMMVIQGNFLLQPRSPDHAQVVVPSNYGDKSEFLTFLNVKCNQFNIFTNMSQDTTRKERWRNELEDTGCTLHGVRIERCATWQHLGSVISDTQAHWTTERHVVKCECNMGSGVSMDANDSAIEGTADDLDGISKSNLCIMKSMEELIKQKVPHT